jgi:hypothetical protein
LFVGRNANVGGFHKRRVVNLVNAG